MFWLLFWVACGGEPSTFEECGDAPCRSRFVLDAFADDPASVLPLLEAIDDPVERVALVLQLAEAHPGETAQLCSSLTLGPARERCGSLNTRPHLWVEPASPSNSTGRPAPGPATRDTLPASAISEYADVEAVDPECPEGASRTACTMLRAGEQASAGRTRIAAAYCRHLEGDEKWRHECAFEAAEEAARSGVEHYPGAAELCLLAGPFAANCLAHLIIELNSMVPPATIQRPEAWAKSLEIATTIETFWTERDPDFTALAVDRYYTHLVAQSYGKADLTVGTPLDSLPPTAVPHVHASAAMHLMSRRVDETHDLAGWASLLDEALDSRAQPSAQRTMQAPVGLGYTSDLWPEDLGDEDMRPAVFYLETSRRTLSEDPTLDRLICILEAAARLELAVKATLLAEGAAHPDDAVSWTARRLLEERQDDTAHHPNMAMPEGPDGPGSLPDMAKTGRDGKGGKRGKRGKGGKAGKAGKRHAAPDR